MARRDGDTGLATGEGRGIRFVFECDEPRQMRYRLDYRPTYPRGKDEYYVLYRVAGWEHVCEYCSWHYFRSPVSAGAPALFSDAESRAAKYRSLLVVLAILLVANLGNLPGLFDGEFISRTSLIGRVAITVQVCVAVLLAYATVRLVLHTRHIRAQHDVR
jgi:hypothetical protein